MHKGELREALDLLTRARTVTEHEPFSELDRAEILFRLGVCRYKLSSISTAIGLFNEAYAIAEGSGLPCDFLRSNILAYRSRCYRRQRDLEAAREDVERALELAQSLDDSPTMANVVRPGVARRGAHGPLGARAQLRGAREGLLRGAERPAEPRPACSTTSAASTSCSASPTRRSST